jgi:hypothetical protein
VPHPARPRDDCGRSLVELARYVRCGTRFLREQIRSGALTAVNIGTAQRPRLVVLPHQLQAWIDTRLVAKAPPRTNRARKPKQTGPGVTDYYP